MTPGLEMLLHLNDPCKIFQCFLFLIFDSWQDHKNVSKIFLFKSYWSCTFIHHIHSQTYVAFSRDCIGFYKDETRREVAIKAEDDTLAVLDSAVDGISGQDR